MVAFKPHLPHIKPHSPRIKPHSPHCQQQLPPNWKYQLNQLSTLMVTGIPVTLDMAMVPPPMVLMEALEVLEVLEVMEVSEVMEVLQDMEVKKLKCIPKKVV